MTKSVYGFARQQIRKGVAPEVVEMNLTRRGLDADASATVISNLMHAKAIALQNAGHKNILYGVLWFVSGVVVTGLSYQTAANTGGSYLLAWGAILFGGIQFFRGMVQLSGRWIKCTAPNGEVGIPSGGS